MRRIVAENITEPAAETGTGQCHGRSITASQLYTALAASLFVEELIYPTPLIDFSCRSLYIAFP